MFQSFKKDVPDLEQGGVSLKSLLLSGCFQDSGYNLSTPVSFPLSPFPSWKGAGIHPGSLSPASADWPRAEVT